MLFNVLRHIYSLQARLILCACVYVCVRVLVHGLV